jgi:hypothetical protein
MENINTPTIVVVIILAVAIIIFLAVKNQKDKKELNPDATDAVEEEKTENEQHREKL